MSDGPAFRQDASNTAAEQALQWGMHNDGLVVFKLHGNKHSLLVQNNEYTDEALMYPGHPGFSGAYRGEGRAFTRKHPETVNVSRRRAALVSPLFVARRMPQTPTGTSDTMR